MNTTSLHVDIASLVIFPESQRPRRCQQGGNRRSLGFVLRHVEKVDERGNNHDAAAYAYYA